MRVYLLLLFGALGCGGSNVVPGSGCAVDGECPLHQLCDPSAKVCTTGCFVDEDCGDRRCGPHGRCFDGSSDGGIGGGGGDDLGSSDDADVTDLASADLTGADLSLCPAICPDTALEPNNSSATATVESLPATLGNLGICPANDADWYIVTAAQMGTLTATLTDGPCGVTLRADWYSSGGNQMTGTSQATPTGWTATATTKANQVRFLRVVAEPAGGQNTYSLSLTLN